LLGDLAQTGTLAVVGGVAMGVGIPMAGTTALTAVGFTGTGIFAGSMAAGMQAGIGNVAAGSIFAGLQSIGATGGLAILGPVGVIAGVTGFAAVGGFSAWRVLRNRRNRRERAIIVIIYRHV
jgi:hypothetical protein